MILEPNSSEDSSGPSTGPLARQNEPDQVHEMVDYWLPPVDVWPPVKALNSDLKIAAIVGDHLCRGLRFEGRLLLLTPENYYFSLKYGRPDFLLVESTWNTATGHWYMSQGAGVSGREELEQVIALARSLNIPTVYWLTTDTAYHEHFHDVTRLFDHVFCADPRETERLRKEGTSAETLLPAVQPALYNPFREFGRHNAFKIGVLYDGLTDVLRLGDQLGILNELRLHDLKIIESRHTLTRPQTSRAPEDLQEKILGCVPEAYLAAALKYAQTCVTLTPSQDSPTRQAWAALAAGACRTPLIHLGELPPGDLRSEFVISHERAYDFLLELVRHHRDPIYRERAAQRAWRRVTDRHTFSHRINTICKALGVEHNWVEYPAASIITPTMRPHLIDKCLEQYDRQTYSNKELVIVLNGDHDPAEYAEKFGQRPDVRFLAVPNDHFAGTCMNMGLQNSQGDLCFRMDDDDHYGDNYILDAALYLRAVDADFFGRAFTYMHLEGRGVFERKAKKFTPCIFRGRDLGYDAVPLAGCSLGGTRSFFSKIQYPDDNALTADAVWGRRVNGLAPESVGLLFDGLNMVVERKVESGAHTWQADLESLLGGSVKAAETIDDLMV